MPFRMVILQKRRPRRQISNTDCVGVSQFGSRLLVLYISLEDTKHTIIADRPHMFGIRFACDHSTYVKLISGSFRQMIEE